MKTNGKSDETSDRKRQKIRVRMLDGSPQILTKRGWMTWNETRNQWQNSFGFQNYPHLNQLDIPSFANISLKDLPMHIRDGDDGGVYIWY